MTSDVRWHFVSRFCISFLGTCMRMSYCIIDICSYPTAYKIWTNFTDQNTDSHAGGCELNPHVVTLVKSCFQRWTPTVWRNALYENHDFTLILFVSILVCNKGDEVYDTCFSLYCNEQNSRPRDSLITYVMYTIMLHVSGGYLHRDLRKA